MSVCQNTTARTPASDANPTENANDLRVIVWFKTRKNYQEGVYGCGEPASRRHYTRMIIVKASWDLSEYLVCDLASSLGHL